MVEIIPFEAKTHLDVFYFLYSIYMKWIYANFYDKLGISLEIEFGPKNEYISHSFQEFLNENGRKIKTYLVFKENKAIGMGTLRCLDSNRGEIKRRG